MKLKIKKLCESAILPQYASEGAAGLDLYACISDYDGMTDIQSESTELIKTGIAIEIPKGYVGLIYARSGLATKKGLRPANCVGVIDSDYRGEIIVALHNDSAQSQSISNGERIAQLVIMPFIHVETELCNELSDTQRGTGGFGSTGIN